MELQARKLLTIVTEAALESKLGAELKRLGATGYTVVDARGSGTRGIRDAEWESSGNIQIEVVCESSVAERIIERLRERYYPYYAMILYASDVSVLRAEKF